MAAQAASVGSAPRNRPRSEPNVEEDGMSRLYSYAGIAASVILSAFAAEAVS